MKVLAHDGAEVMILHQTEALVRNTPYLTRSRSGTLLQNLLPLLPTFVILGACSNEAPVQEPKLDSPSVLEVIIAAEERLLIIEPALAVVADEIVANRELRSTNSIFAHTPIFNDVRSDLEPARSIDDLGITTTQWNQFTEISDGLGEKSLFWPILSSFSEISSAAFGIEDSQLIGDDNIFTLTRLSLLGTSSAGHRLNITGEIGLTWGHDNTIIKMEALWFEGKSLPVQIFADVTANNTSEHLFRALTRSLHEEMIVQRFENNPLNPPTTIIEYEAFDRHPGLAVGDVNNDGHDDIYITNRHSPNELLIWTETGFEDEANIRGADISGLSSSALILDLDNDGDKDIVVGRTMRASTILRNEDGRFSEWDIGLELPKLVSTVISADVNGDGRLDLFFSTYAASLIEQQREEMVRNGRLGEPILQGIVSAQVSQTLGVLVAQEDFDFYLTRPGPTNVLILSSPDGGYVTSNDQTLKSIWSNTYAAAFSDYDSDGDQDLYLSNDFADNQLLQNDNGVFLDVTEATGLSGFGFGMGASFGDYNNDGELDLYLSNMYSRAGRRITGAMTNADDRVVQGALGNKLYTNNGGHFTHTEANVERAGWSWGGQFGDVDNNGLADLYVPNGYYSAPDEVAIERDC